MLPFQLETIDPFRDVRIAVVGVSQHPEKYGYKVYTHLRKHGYTVYPVNIHNGIIQGERVYRTLHELTRSVGRPDLVVFVIPPRAAYEVMREAEALGVRRFWFQPGSDDPHTRRECQEKQLDCTLGMCIMKATGREKA